MKNTELEASKILDDMKVFWDETDFIGLNTWKDEFLRYYSNHKWLNEFLEEDPGNGQIVLGEVVAKYGFEPKFFDFSDLTTQYKLARIYSSFKSLESDKQIIMFNMFLTLCKQEKVANEGLGKSLESKNLGSLPTFIPEFKEGEIPKYAI